MIHIFLLKNDLLSKSVCYNLLEEMCKTKYIKKMIIAKLFKKGTKKKHF